MNWRFCWLDWRPLTVLAASLESIDHWPAFSWTQRFGSWFARSFLKQAHCWIFNLWDVSNCCLIFGSQVEVVSLLLIDCIYTLITSSCHLLDCLLFANFTDRVPCRPVMEILPQDAWQRWAFSMRRGWVNYFFPDSGGIHTSYFNGRRTMTFGKLPNGHAFFDLYRACASLRIGNTNPSKSVAYEP